MIPILIVLLTTSCCFYFDDHNWLDKKIEELQERTADVLIQEKKLRIRQDEYEKNKAILDKQTEIYKKLEP